MIVRILHLYPDLMNLYGEQGNLKVLEQHLRDQEVEVQVDRKDIDEELEFEQYDFIYMGSGTERNQKVALQYLFPYSKRVREAIEDGRIFLFTGNSFELLGDRIVSGDGTVYEGLKCFDFKTQEHLDRRITTDIIFNVSWCKRPIVGFINKCSEIKGIKNPLFHIQMGTGDFLGSKCEGILYKNLFGTHVIGPILVKNPHFLSHILQIIFSQKGIRISQEIMYPYENQAYEVTLTELLQCKGRS